MVFHDYPLTLEERLENAFLSFKKEEDVNAILQEMRFEAFNKGWEAHKNSL